MDQVKRKLGRPSSGGGKNGEPERVADWPKLALSVRPLTRAKLNACASVEHRSSWKILEDALTQYLERLPPADRKMVEKLASTDPSVKA